MKIKVKIWGLDETDGTRKSFTRTVDCPDFVDSIDQFLGVSLTTSVAEQVDAWIQDNWQEVVVKPCEDRFIHPIIDCKMIPTKVKVDKKKEVIDLLSTACIESDIDGKAIILGTLATLWPTIKRHPALHIAKIVLQSVIISHRISTSHVREISDRVDKIKLIRDAG